jgi:hypothetical protein
MNEEGMLKPALIGGILLGVLSSIPVVKCCCCAWIIAGGALAAYVYIRETRNRVTLGRGVLLGLLTGAFGSIINILFELPRLLISKVPMSEQFNKAIEQVPNLPAETRQMVSAMMAREGMMGFLIALSFVFMFIGYCLLAMLGGAIGVALFEKRAPVSETQDVQTYEPPENEPPANLPPPPPPPPPNEP